MLLAILVILTKHFYVKHFLGVFIAVSETCINTGTKNEIKSADVSHNASDGAASSGTKIKDR